MTREPETTPTSTRVASAAQSSAHVWALVAIVWHAVLGVGMVIFGLLVLFNVTDIFGVIQLPRFDSFIIQLVVFVVALALGGVQLRYWRGLWTHHPRARMMSLWVNLAGLVIGLFIAFRQLTCTTVCPVEMNPFSAVRLEMWVPPFVVTLLFGVLVYGMWRKDTAELFNETGAQREALNAYVYISPYLLTAGIFTLGLLLYAFGLSFTDYGDSNLYGGRPANWVGTSNYSRVLVDNEFLTAISNVIWYAFIVVVLQTIIALSLALMMSARFAGWRWFRTLFYAPSVTSSVVISLIFLWLFNGRGIVNYVLYEILGMTEPLGDLGLRTPNTNWLNTPTRLGDMTYLKPFFDGNWHWLLGVPLVIVAIIAVVRISLWLRDRAVNWRVVLAAGVTAIGAAVMLIVLLGLIPSATGAAEAVEAGAIPIRGDAVLKALLISLGVGLLGGLVVNFLELERDIDMVTRSAALGVLAAVFVSIPAVLLFAALAAPGALSAAGSAGVTIYTLLILPLVIAPLVAALAANLSHRLFLPEEKGTGFAPQPGGNMARRLDRWASWMSTGLLAVLALWCVAVVLAASATTGLALPRELGDQQFGALLLRGPSVTFMVIMLLNIFTTSPTFMIMFLAALQDIPAHLYEAAQIDGANRWQQFWNVTLPMLRPVMLLIVVLGTIGTFQIFDQVHVMTAGGPLNTTLTPVYLIYTKALGDQRAMQMGYAAAMAFVLGVIIFAITYVQRNYIERGTEQY